MNKDKSYTVKEATRKLVRYCSYQERCQKDVIAKLKKMRMIAGAIDQIIVYLIQENYLNEGRFARSFVRGKFRIKKWGRDRIIGELEQRNISRQDIEAALSEITEEEYRKTFDALAKKRMTEISDSPPQKKRKQLTDYLLYRGWERQLIYEKVADLIE